VYYEIHEIVHEVKPISLTETGNLKW